MTIISQLCLRRSNVSCAECFISEHLFIHVWLYMSWLYCIIPSVLLFCFSWGFYNPEPLVQFDCWSVDCYVARGLHKTDHHWTNQVMYCNTLIQLSQCNEEIAPGLFTARIRRHLVLIRRGETEQNELFTNYKTTIRQKQKHRISISGFTENVLF